MEETEAEKSISVEKDVETTSDKENEPIKELESQTMGENYTEKHTSVESKEETTSDKENEPVKELESQTMRENYTEKPTSVESKEETTSDKENEPVKELESQTMRENYTEKPTSVESKEETTSDKENEPVKELESQTMRENYTEKPTSVESKKERAPVEENEPIKEVESGEMEKDNEKLILSQSSNGESDEENFEESPMVDADIVNAISDGFLAKILPELQQSKGILEELMRSQQVLIETVEQENSKFNECQSFQELDETMKKAKVYHSKLLSLKREMNGLHEKSARLKKRAVKLQQQKQRDELHRAHKRDKEVEREKMLEAKPAPRRQATPSIDTDTSVQPLNAAPDT